MRLGSRSPHGQVFVRGVLHALRRPEHRGAVCTGANRMNPIGYATSS